MTDVHAVKSGKKWLPLENSPQVMNQLARKLGLNETLEFCDVWSVTDEALLAMVPRPVHALLFIYPATENSELAFEEEQASMKEHEAGGEEEAVIWFHQIIGNACGTYGMLYCVINGGVEHIETGSELDVMMKQARAESQEERNMLIYEWEELEKAHAAAANIGDSKVPLLDDKVLYCFTAFVRGKDGHLWELEGRRKGPIDRGVLEPEEDILSERVLGLSVFPYMNREKITESRFSCLALVDSGRADT